MKDTPWTAVQKWKSYINNEYVEALKSLNLTPIAAHVLLALSEHRNMNIAGLAAEMGVELAQVQYACQITLSLGLIRMTDRCMGVVSYGLTELGIEMVARVRERLTLVNGILLALIANEGGA